MTLTVGVKALPPDLENTVKAIVLLSSNEILNNPVVSLSQPEVINQVYTQLQITPDTYDILNLAFAQVISPFFGQFAYEFVIQFILIGVPVPVTQFIGPPGPVGPPGPPGAVGPPGPTGPAGG